LCKTHISTVYCAKPWYGCNELPETEDITDAFFSRQLQITLLNKYVSNSNEINNETIFKADPKLTDKLTQPKQLTGILNFALEGLKRLIKQGFFTPKYYILYGSFVIVFMEVEATGKK
jgi:putative DNA primase/helicase